MYARTKAFGEFQSKQWKKVVDMADKVQSAFEKLSPEQQKKMSTALASPYANEENRMSIDEVRDLMENPITSLLPGYTETLAPMLFESPFIIINTMDDIGFITSDNPCVWFDIADYQKSRLLGAGGMISPTLEITFPLSPHQILLFKKKLVVSGAYIEINDNETIDTLIIAQDILARNILFRIVSIKTQDGSNFNSPTRGCRRHSQGSKRER